MLLTVIDLETTGTDSTQDQILEVGIILMDTKKPKSQWPVYHKIVRHERYSGSAYAIALNARIFQMLKNYEIGKVLPSDLPVVHAENLAKDLYMFFQDNKFPINKRNGFTVYALGKNPQGFDIKFLQAHPGVSEVLTFGHRAFDPTILYTDWENDIIPPGLEVVKQRAGLGNVVTHNAKEDAFDVADVLLKHINSLKTQ